MRGGDGTTRKAPSIKRSTSTAAADGYARSSSNTLAAYVRKRVRCGSASSTRRIFKTRSLAPNPIAHTCGRRSVSRLDVETVGKAEKVIDNVSELLRNVSVLL